MKLHIGMRPQRERVARTIAITIAGSGTERRRETLASFFNAA